MTYIDGFVASVLQENKQAYLHHAHERSSKSAICAASAASKLSQPQSAWPVLVPRYFPPSALP